MTASIGHYCKSSGGWTSSRKHGGSRATGPKDLRQNKQSKRCLKVQQACNPDLPLPLKLHLMGTGLALAMKRLQTTTWDDNVTSIGWDC